MGMKALDELRDMLCEHIEDIKDDMKQKGVTDSNLERAHVASDTIKNIDKICIMDETGGYSQAGDWEARGNFGYAREGYNEGGNSYRRDSMGRYSRDDGMSYRDGNSMRGRRYSRGGMMEHIDMMMEEADTDEQREAIKRFKKQLQSM